MGSGWSDGSGDMGTSLGSLSSDGWLGWESRRLGQVGVVLAGPAGPFFPDGCFLGRQQASSLRWPAALTGRWGGGPVGERPRQGRAGQGDGARNSDGQTDGGRDRGTGRWLKVNWFWTDGRKWRVGNLEEWTQLEDLVRSGLGVAVEGAELRTPL